MSTNQQPTVVLAPKPGRGLEGDEKSRLCYLYPSFHVGNENHLPINILRWDGIGSDCDININERAFRLKPISVDAAEVPVFPKTSIENEDKAVVSEEKVVELETRVYSGDCCA